MGTLFPLKTSIIYAAWDTLHQRPVQPLAWAEQQSSGLADGDMAQQGFLVPGTAQGNDARIGKRLRPRSEVQWSGTQTTVATQCEATSL